jgi:hypothetical protein
LSFEHPFSLGGTQGVDHVDGVGEEDTMSVLASGVAECCGQVGFAQADQPQEDNVGFFFDEAQPEEFLDLEPIDHCNECSYETNGHMYKDQKGETLIIVMICAYYVIRGDQHVAAHRREFSRRRHGIRTKS